MMATMASARVAVSARSQTSGRASFDAPRPTALTVRADSLRCQSGLACSSSVLCRTRRVNQTIRMGPMKPDEPNTETERSPLDFPQEWMKPNPSRRPDIFPEFKPVPPVPDFRPMPGDPEVPDDEEEEEEKESDPDNPDEEEEEKEKEEEPAEE